MKEKVRCDECHHFLPAWDKINGKNMCAKRHRIIFRKPKSLIDTDYGYIRYCEDFLVSFNFKEIEE